MQPQNNQTAVYTSLFILAAGVSSIVTFIPRHESGLLFLAYFSAFVGYFWSCRFPPHAHRMLAIGIFLRLLAFVQLPSLSDDFFRFIWDGHLINNGLSPFAELPRVYSEQGEYPPGLSKELFLQLNSPDYFTIYPPLNQAVFWLAAKFGDTNWLLSANIIRSFLLIADIGIFFLLRKLLLAIHKNPNLANWYFLNPLVILEGVGNLHFEIFVIFFLTSGLLYWHRQKTLISGLSMGLAIASKLLPLIYLPALAFNGWWKKGLIVCVISCSVALLSFVPMLDQSLITSLQESIGLYFQKFEFNASVYFLFREIGYWIVGYNIIGLLGPWLSVITFVAITSLAICGNLREWPISKILLFSLSIYLFLATTVHPWYLLPLILFGILSGYYYPIIWSLMVIVTYFGYSKSGFELSAFWIVLEYIVVIITLGIELFKKTHEQNS